jgi:ABC-type cobalamin/Fe3+-siderophores transport system ATPase subunit
VRIERLEIKNFRCLEDISINFPDNNIAVIVGINGSGKTAILGNRSGGNQENELHGIGWNHYEQAVVIDFIANNSE